jgi:hypothetical protein
MCDASPDLHRPVEGEERVPPELWRQYREEHEFLGPSCFCGIFVIKDQAVYTEVAVFISTSGPFSGQYVAQCAKGKCGYLGPSESHLSGKMNSHFEALQYLLKINSLSLGCL